MELQELFIVVAITIGLVSVCKSFFNCVRWVWVMFLRPQKNLKEYGSWAIITGSAQGVGKALAFQMAIKGLNIVLVDKNRSSLEATSNELIEKHGWKVEIKSIVMDLSKLSGEEIVKTIEEETKGLDVGILINNAGMSYPYPRFFHEVDSELMLNIMKVNMEAPTWVIKAVLPGMLKKKKGAIVNIGSASTLAPSFPLYTLYATTKAREQDVRIAAQLRLLMESRASSTSVPQVVVVASTNRVEAVDPALRRSGRFDAEIEVTTPSEDERFQILKLYTKKIPLDPDVDLQALAAKCNGFAGADLEALCREAAMSAMRRYQDADKVADLLSLTKEDWENAKSLVNASITRGVTVEIPKVTWEDIGGLKDLKKKLQQAVEWPIKYSTEFSRLGISPIRGILLYGPPGCSKTTLAKAAAHAAQASFFSLSGAELFSMYVGEGEALLRNTFRRARLAAPSIIFFDEADVVAAKRGGSSSNSSTVGERLLSTLLTEMDGLEEAKGVFVLAATNRPHAIDAALVRPGRFDLVLFVQPPDLEGRNQILSVLTREMKLGDVDLKRIAVETEHFTGAELKGLCKEAGIVALREDISATVVSHRHFQTAKDSLKPALTKADVDSYLAFASG